MQVVKLFHFLGACLGVLSFGRPSMITRTMMFLCCVAMASLQLGCASRYSIEALRALAPNANIVDVCVVPPSPMAGPDSVVWAHKVGTGKTVSDVDWDEFETFAEEADIIYRFNSKVPETTANRLPWPYHEMKCHGLSLVEGPPLPKGMEQIPISDRTREALVAALSSDDALERSSPTANIVSDKRFLGQVLTGPAARRSLTPEKIKEVGQMLRDAIRGALPTTSRRVGPSDEQISIIDTKMGQIIGGLGAGAAMGAVPGGVLIANEMQRSGQLPQPSREFMLGQGLGEMGSGLAQMAAGGGMTVGGAGASATGGGALVGVPLCGMGVALAANGTVTFFNGARTIIVAICDWNELPSIDALAASAPKDPVSKAPAAGGGGSSAAAPAQGAKPAAKASTSSTGQAPAQRPKRHGAGTKGGKNTTTWVKCTGQMHHAISRKVHDALEDHQHLKGIYKYRDNRFVTQAVDEAAHKGYQKWHSALDKEIVAWIRREKNATQADFEAYLLQRYAQSDLKPTFPNGF